MLALTQYYWKAVRSNHTEQQTEWENHSMQDIASRSEWHDDKSEIRQMSGSGTIYGIDENINVV